MLQLLDAKWAYWWSNNVSKGILYYCLIMLLFSTFFSIVSWFFKRSWSILFFKRSLIIWELLWCGFCYFNWFINMVIWAWLAFRSLSQNWIRMSDLLIVFLEKVIKWDLDFDRMLEVDLYDEISIPSCKFGKGEFPNSYF